MRAFDIGGRTLVGRQVDAFADCGITEFVVITGYGSTEMDQELQRIAGERNLVIRSVYNPFYCVADNLASCWMARHEMDALWNMRADIADYRALDRADIADDSAGFERRPELRGQVAEGAHRRAEDYEIGIRDGARRVNVHAVDEAQLHRFVEGRLRTGAAGDMSSQAFALHHPGERRAFEPKTDLGGLRGSLDITRQILARLADLERRHFDGRQ